MKTIVLTTAVALLTLSTVAASAYPYGYRHHRGYYRHATRIPGSHIIGSGDRHGTASGGPVGGFKSQP